MAAFCISIFIHLICCIKKTKYAKRCSVKSSTIYMRPLFLQFHFLRWKWSKVRAFKFWPCENDAFFGTKRTCLFLFHHFITCHLLFKEQTKCTKRCSVKSSTIYTRPPFLHLYFSLPKSTKTLSDYIWKSIFQSSFFSLPPEILYLKRNKIDQKMQCEKL